MSRGALAEFPGRRGGPELSPQRDAGRVDETALVILVPEAEDRWPRIGGATTLRRPSGCRPT